MIFPKQYEGTRLVYYIVPILKCIVLCKLFKYNEKNLMHEDRFARLHEILKIILLITWSCP